MPELEDPAKLLLSTPHTLVWLPTFSDRPLWLVFRSISFTVCGQTALMSTVSCPSDIKVCHCGHLMPESGPAHNSSCKSSHLPPRLNLENLLSPRLLLLPCPSSHQHFFPPKPACPSWTINSSSTSKLFASNRFLRSCCSRHLSPQLEPLRRRNANCLASPRSRRDQARP